MPAGPVAVLGGGATALVLLVVVIMGGASDDDAATAASSSCGPVGGGISVDAANLPTQQVGAYGPTQLVNAVAIINAGKALDLTARDQTIGVMTAIGESTLTVVDHGDVAGPDSRGLFQQRANGAWGSYADRMNPTISATNFFKVLAAVPGRASMEPTLVAHEVQRNANPFHYAGYWDDAVAIVTALAGAPTGPAAAAPGPAQAAASSPTATASPPAGVALVGVSAGTGNQACTGAAPIAGTVSATGWVRPNAGPVTSGFGMRTNPVNGVYRLHAGTDFGGPCDSPILAAAAGVVVDVRYSSSTGHTIVIDHGGGITTRSLHMYPQGVMATVGQQVQAGTQIGRVGSAGNSTGCHLHFEVRQSGQGGVDQPMDPEPFLASHGVPA